MASEDRSGKIFKREDALGGRTFDELAIEFADDTLTRRKALTLVGAAILGSTLVPLFPGIAQARRRRRRHRRSPGSINQPTLPDLCTNPFNPADCSYTTNCLGCQEGQICKTSGCSSTSLPACYPLVESPSSTQGICGGAPSCNDLTDCTTQSDCPVGHFCGVTCCPTATTAHGAIKCVPSCSSATVMATTKAASKVGSAPAPTP